MDNADYLRLPIYSEGLSSALGFDQADLDANRAGRLGPGQRRAQVRQLRVTTTGTIGVLVLACVFAFITGASGLGTRTGLNALLATGALLVAAGYFGWYGIRLFQDVRSGQVLSAEGVVRPGEREIKIGRTPVWTYYWNIDGGQRFAVIGKAYAALTPGRHRVYYLPSSRRVIAAEPI